MTGNPLFHLLRQSDMMTKIVLLLLLVMSIMCWTIFFYKAILLRLKQRQMRIALQQLKKIQSIEDIRAIAASSTHTMPGYILTKQLSLLKSLLETKENKLILQDQELILLQQHVEQAVDEIVFQEEAYLPLLSTSAAAAPLLGLFGTIWGLVHSFVSISERQQADIVTIAPGIAEALITTLAGLMVAIPALLMFHYIHAQIRHLEQYLLNLADRFTWIIQTWFMKR